MDPKESILIVDDDASICATLARILVRKGYETDTAATGRKALEKIQGRSFNLTLLDIRLPDVVGMDLLRRLRESQPDMAVILVTAYASIQTATQALKEGAAAYIIKPVDTDEMLAAIRQALDKQRLVLENRRLYQETRRELGQRKRAEEALRQTAARLERFSHLLLALARVGLQAQESLAVDEILVMTSNEVKELGFESATLMREGENLVLRHTSIEGARREAVEGLCGAKMIGFAALLEDPILRAPVKTRKTVFVAEPARALSRVLPPTTFGELERVLRILHVGQAILAPLIARDRLIGLLVLWSPDLGQDDVPAVTALANQMAVAIENARLLRKLREQSKQLRAFAARLADVEEASRQQLARELHDQVGQNLTALGIDLSVVRAHMLKDTPEAVRARLDDALGLVELTSEGIRDVMANLRPPPLGRLWIACCAALACRAVQVAGGNRRHRAMRGTGTPAAAARRERPISNRSGGTDQRIKARPSHPSDGLSGDDRFNGTPGHRRRRRGVRTQSLGRAPWAPGVGVGHHDRARRGSGRPLSC